MYCTIQVAKTKAVISFAVTAKLICVFVFANAKIRFSHVAAQIMVLYLSIFFLFLHVCYTGLRPIYVIFFEFLPISFQMKNNDDMRL